MKINISINHGNTLITVWPTDNFCAVPELFTLVSFLNVTIVKNTATAISIVILVSLTVIAKLRSILFNIL